MAITSNFEVLEVETNTFCIKHVYGKSEYPIIHLAYTPDSEFLYTVSANSIDVWSVPTKKMVDQLKFRPFSGNKYIAFSTCGKKFSLISRSGNRVNEFDTKTFQLIRKFEGKYYHVKAIKYSHDGQNLIGITRNGEYFKWDIVTGGLLPKYSRRWFFCRELLDSCDRYLEICNDGETIVTFIRDYETIELLTPEDEDVLVKTALKFFPAMQVNGCSFHDLHAESDISQETQKALKKNGAFIDIY